MANPISITSSNAKLTITVRNTSGIVVGPFTVQGYANDAALATEPVPAAEAVMGVDGFMAVGYLPRITPLTVSLMANSPSNLLFETWDQAQKALGDVLVADAVVVAPSLGKTWIYTRGALTRVTPMPTARKTFGDAVTWEMSWESVTAAPIAV